MSFILDALRKSESERRRDAAASLSRAPLAAVRQRTPVWSWLLIGLLSVALLAITTVWWRGNRETLTTSTGSRPPAATAENPVPDGVLLENAGRDNRSAENLPLPPSTTAPTTTTPGTRTPPDAPASLIPPPVRPIRELTALEPNLPRFRLELLAYNGRDPAGGSAWINGQRYFVGERVANGPELVEVLPDGVILAYRGQWFLLTTR